MRVLIYEHFSVFGHAEGGPFAPTHYNPKEEFLCFVAPLLPLASPSW